MALPLILLLLSSFVLPTHGFFSPTLIRSGPPVRLPLRTVSLLSSTTSGDEQKTPPKQTDELTTAIVNLDNSDNIDDIRRARSLARRDRLSRWLAATAESDDEVRDRQDTYFLIAAILPTIVAFVSWQDISFGLSEFLDTYGVKAVDGNQFANNLLRPTITGVVVPVISIALATLVSTTVNVLRQRQVDLRAFVNKEACEIRLLRRVVFGMFGTRQHAGRRARALTLLCGYVEQLMKESEVGAIEELKEIQLSGGIAENELERLSAMLHGIPGASASRQGSVGFADDLSLSLIAHRSERVALLLSVFPTVHWGILIGLSLSICMTFLLVSNQQVLQYLNSIQLRFMFATIVGVLASTATLCWDLSDPFSGSYSIEGASTQLADVRVCLREDVREALIEIKVSSSTRKFFRSILGGPDVPTTERLSTKSGEDVDSEDISPSSRYGLISTLYFHLLTGPLGDNVRVIGDVMVWLTTLFGRRLRAIANWRQWSWLKKKESSRRQERQ
mmetsp:Transcript_10115/g.18157  ORF Transcript_10115/g.18157 Transcript_10115/m.18157 type:complete len:504 (+) Transcript_10115:195-1706(+)